MATITLKLSDIIPILAAAHAKIFSMPLSATLRRVNLQHGMVIEQNPHKDSPYAERARKGEHISWFIPRKGRWIMITDEFIYVNGKSYPVIRETQEN